MGPKLISQPSGEAGFTLIELLVVIAILGVLGVGAALTVGRGGPETAESSDMARFQVAYATQAALAVQGREQRGLAVKAGGLRAMRPGPQGWVTETTDNVPEPDTTPSLANTSRFVLPESSATLKLKGRFQLTPSSGIGLAL